MKERLATSSIRERFHGATKVQQRIAGRDRIERRSALRPPTTDGARGTSEGSPENRTITISYRLISNGSALAETFTSASGKETMSIYHRDGGALLVTHYCAQGNQARLKATEATEARVVFEFLDATNVSSEQGVMRRLVFTFHPDAFDHESMYRDGNGEQEATTLHFVRE